MTEPEIRRKLAEIERSANPELLCQELDDQALVELMEAEKHYPFYMPRAATEEYQRRMIFRNQMYRKDPPPRSNWSADPQ